NDAFVFPVGDSSYYRPISMSNPSSGSARFRGEYFKASPQPLYNRYSKDPSLHHVSGCEYWLLDRISSTNNVFVTLSWGDTATSCGITNISELMVARWDGSQWKDHGSGSTTGNLVAGTITTLATVTAFSPFTLASTTINNPLPVTLINFNARINSGVTKLTWTTASEINNDYFTLEKSKDGSHFFSFSEQAGAGNSNNTLNYYDIDENPYKGVSYYRLKQTDFNGDFEYSKIVTINNIKEGTITAFPNPVKNILTFTNISNNDNIKVYASNGQIIFNGNTTTINTENWSTGLYQIIITDNIGEQIEQIKIVK
ncbi:MAG: T9SS type A sorting domain-containing protein, partial [Flavobacteriales bacterium]|nr:T9SS type A sorting domain-containing protein [Flavobacteriales bacterium]